MSWWKNYFGKASKSKTKVINQSSQERKPIPTWDGDTPVLVMYISTCANMMMAREADFLRSIGKFDAMFDRNKAGDYVLERISLIVSFLLVYKIRIKEGWDKMWLKAISANYDTSKRITNLNITDLLNKRYDFYTLELEVLKDSHFAIPNTIISKLYKPMIEGEMSHKMSIQNGFSIEENLAIWKIVTTEVGKMMEKIKKNREFIYSSQNNPDAHE